MKLAKSKDTTHRLRRWIAQRLGRKPAEETAVAAGPGDPSRPTLPNTQELLIAWPVVRDALDRHLQQPLNNLKGVTRLLLDSNLDPRGRQLATNLQHTVEELLTALEHHLDLVPPADAQTGFELNALLDDLLQTLDRQARQRHKKLVIDRPPSPPQPLSGDSRQVRKLLIQPLALALEHAPGERLHLHLHHGNDPGDRLLLQCALCLSDDAKAPALLDLEAHPELTSDLDRLEKAIQGAGGTLQWSRHCLRLRLILQRAAPREPTPPRLRAGGNRPLLDEERLESLRALGHANGSNVLEKAVRHYLDHTPEELHRLRQAIDARNTETARLLAHNLKSSSGMLGANTLADQFTLLEKRIHQARFEEAGRLLDAIHELLPPVLDALETAMARAKAPPPTAPSQVDQPSGRILLVDDDPAFRLITAATLTKAGFVVEEAASGAEALVRVASDAPDLILLDALMEGMDGFELCQRLLSLPGTEQLPVLMVTGLDDHQSVNRAFQAGAAGFISKPVNYPVLIQRIRFQLRVAKEAEALRESREQLALAQRLARLGHWRWAVEDDRFQLSEELARLCGLPPDEPPLTLDRFLALVHPDDREPLRQNLEQAARRGQWHPIDYRMQPNPGGEVLYLHQELTQVTPGILLGAVQDVTRQYQWEQQIRKLAYSDELTGLASRSYFMRHLQDTINLARRHDENFSLLYLDLDSFKDINDTLGHDVGDRLLKTVAKRLRQALRNDDFAARLGGDEFCILVDNVSIDYAAQLADRCLDAVNQPVLLGGQHLNPRISIGIANFPSDGQDAQSLLKAADSAMYAAKTAGKHRYAFYRPELTARARQRLKMEHELRQAVEKEQLILHYQPQISLKSGRIVGLEALVRWQHPKRGLIPPLDFIPVAERLGLIDRIGRQVLELACRQARLWREAGLPEVRISVNLSPSHFRDPRMAEQVRAILQQYQWPAERLELEVTENVVQTEKGNLSCFANLKALGLQIAIDDFGTGYSSLASLKQLPIDTLKVDRLFVRDMIEDPDSATLVGTIVGLAKALNLKVVAEGVETEEELQILAALGCDTVQGFLFAPPQPASRIPELLRADPNERFLEATQHLPDRFRGAQP